MVERLFDIERQIIKENWYNIRNQVLENSFANIEIRNYTIKAKIENGEIKLSIKEKEMENVMIMANINSKIIKFKYYIDKKQTTIEELIYNSSSIIYFIDKFQMQHAIFKKREKDKIEEESVTLDNLDEIFDNPDINEIIDDNFDENISEDMFKKYKRYDEDLSNYYDEFSFQKYSKMAKIISQQLSKKIITSKKRTELRIFINNLDIVKKKLL